MSSNLYYRPTRTGDVLLPDELKYAIKNLDELNNIADGIVDEGFIPVLRGMAAGGVKGADKLIKAIEKHGQVELKELY